LEIGSIWFDRILRLQKEREYIKKYKSNYYNQVLPNQNSKKKLTQKILDQIVLPLKLTIKIL
jgi:hypothetical protein